MPSPVPPLAYQTGHQDFYGRDFLVTKDVLIPRPETEQLIDLTLTLAGRPFLPGVKPTPPQLPPHPKILDLGTGSGCIGLTLALKLPDANLTLADISETALKVAQKNAKKLGVKNATFVQSDLLNFSQTTGVEKMLSADQSSDNFDLILANLPYVDPSWPWLDKKQLSFEPSLALYANNHGLALIFRLLDQLASPNYPSTSFLILEADLCQHQKILDYASNLGFKHLQTSGYGLLLRTFL